MLVRDLKVCKPTGSHNRPSNKGGNTVAVSSAPGTPPYATAGPVSYPDSLMFSSPTSTTSSSFSQVGPSSRTTSSSYSSSPGRDLRPHEYQCLMSMPAACELMPQNFAQGGAAPDGYSMSMSSSSFMTGPDTSFSQGLVASYEPLPTAFSAPAPYGFAPVQQSFLSAYPPSSDGSQAMYNAPTAYAVQPPTYNDYYPPSTSAMTTQMSNLAIGNHPAGGVIYTEQRGVHIRDISRRASEDQIRNMIRDVTGPEASLIEMIKVPTQDGTPRGHAFIHFRSANLAKRMVDHLNGYEFKGRKLQVRLMKEGEAISGGGGAVAASTASQSSSKQQQQQPPRSSGSGKHHRPRKEDGKRAERKERDNKPQKSTSKVVASTTLVASKSSTADPLVVGGYPATASSSSTSSAKEKHGKKSSVIIADGSSGHRPSDGDKR